MAAKVVRPPVRLRGDVIIGVLLKRGSVGICDVGNRSAGFQSGHVRAYWESCSSRHNRNGQMRQVVVVKGHGADCVVVRDLSWYTV